MIKGINHMIECFGICSENCSAFQNGKCILNAKKAETENDFKLYKEDKIGIKSDKVEIKDNITYCASDCKHINCIHNKENISIHSVLHSWCIPEAIPDCPIGKGKFDMNLVLDNLT